MRTGRRSAQPGHDRGRPGSTGGSKSLCLSSRSAEPTGAGSFASYAVVARPLRPRK